MDLDPYDDVPNQWTSARMDLNPYDDVGWGRKKKSTTGIIYADMILLHQVLI